MRAIHPLFCAILALSLAGCKAEKKPAKAPIRRLVLGTTQEPGSLDPAFSYRSGTWEILGLVARGLTYFDPQWRVQPDLLEALPKVETSTAGRVVTWKLKPGLKWSDGRPLTAHDLVFAHTIEKDQRLQTLNAALMQQVDSFKALDETTFQVTWKNHFRGVFDPRVHAVLPQHKYPAITRPAQFRGMAKKPLSNGPYLLAEWKPSQYLRFRSNPHFHGQKPYFDELIFRIFPGEEAFYAALKSKQIDALGPASGLSLAHAQRLAKKLKDSHELVQTDSGLFLHLETKLDHPLLQQKELRKYLSRALDRKEMAALVYGGAAAGAQSIFAPRHPAFREHPAQGVSEEEIKKIVSKALEKVPAEKRPLRLAFASGSEAAERAATYIGQKFNAWGLKVSLRAQPLKVLYSQLKEGKQAPLVLFAWRTRPDWGATALLSTEGRQNFVGYSEPKMDALLERASQTGPQADWIRVLHQVEDQFLEDMPFIPLLFRKELCLKPKKLQGFKPTGTTTPVTWNAEQWRLSP